MRYAYTVLVEHDDGVVAVGRFVAIEGAQAYADSLPKGRVRGVARVMTTDEYRVETGHGVVARRRPVEVLR